MRTQVLEPAAATMPPNLAATIVVQTNPHIRVVVRHSGVPQSADFLPQATIADVRAYFQESLNIPGTATVAAGPKPATENTTVGSLAGPAGQPVEVTFARRTHEKG